MNAVQNRIVQEARGYLGCRYRHQGRSRSGIDCIGLPIEVAKTVFAWDFDITNYPRQAADETMLRLCQERLVSVPKAALEPGDVLIMRFENQRHAGIVGDYPHPGELSLIHAYAPRRKVVEARLDSVWLSRVLAAFRFPEAV